MPVLQLKPRIMPAHVLEEVSVDATGDHIHQIYNNEVVISGLSGRLPESDNIAEFREHLINGDDMVTADGRRWEPGKIR